MKPRRQRSIKPTVSSPSKGGAVRPESGHVAVRRRPGSGHAADSGEGESAVRKRAGRVNQRMINRMLELKRQGVTLREIARQVGCSERSVRRHTKGVAPQLVHATDQPVPNLLDWCVRCVLSANKKRSLSVKELNQVVVRARRVIAKLDPYTVEHLEADPVSRRAFLHEDVLRPALRDIAGQRQVAMAMAQLGACQ